MADAGMSGPSSQRTIMILLATASSFFIYMTTEQCFAQADVRNAITMVQTLRAAPDVPSIPEAILLKHPNIKIESISWQGNVTDSCYGFVRVRAGVPAPGEVTEYLFDVNISGQRLHPANKRTKELMLNLRQQMNPVEKPVEKPLKEKS